MTKTNQQEGEGVSNDEKIDKLVSSCKASVHITFNGHNECYEPIGQYIERDNFEDVPNDIKNRIVELDTIVEVQLYPYTPIGFYIVAHYNLSDALDLALECLDD